MWDQLCANTKNPRNQPPCSLHCPAPSAAGIWLHLFSAVRLLYEAEEVVMLSRHFSYEVKAHSICSCDTKMDGYVSD